MDSAEVGTSVKAASKEVGGVADSPTSDAPAKEPGGQSPADSACARLRIHSAGPNWVELSLPCSIDAADQLNEFSVWYFADLQKDVRESVRAALRELVLNAIEWGGRSDVTKRVQIAIFRGRRVVLCRVRDLGKGFRIENLSPAAICSPEDGPFNHMLVREQKGLLPDGFGLPIVRSCIDELIYSDSGDQVLFLKYIDPSDAAAQVAPALWAD